MGSLSDGELLRRMSLGDREAWAELFERHYAKAYSMAYKLTRDPDTTEEVVQDAFIRVHRYAHSFNQKREFRPWLWRIIYNIVTTRSKSRILIIPLETQRYIADPTHSYTDDEERIDMDRRIERALDQLPPHDREFIVLFMIGGLRASEMANLYDSNEGAVSVRKHRILKRLKERSNDE